MNLLSLAQSKLAKARVTLDIDEYDRKVLAKSKGAVFVCNQLLPGLDEWILLSLLGEHYESVKILYPYPTPPPKPLPNHRPCGCHAARPLPHPRKYGPCPHRTIC